MTRTDFMYAFDAVRPDPHDRACFSSGRDRLRQDVPNRDFSSIEEYGDRGEVARTGCIVRPDRRAALRNGRSPRRYLFDYIAAGM